MHSYLNIRSVGNSRCSILLFHDVIGVESSIISVNHEQSNAEINQHLIATPHTTVKMD